MYCSPFNRTTESAVDHYTLADMFSTISRITRGVPTLVLRFSRSFS